MVSMWALMIQVASASVIMTASTIPPTSLVCHFLLLLGLVELSTAVIESSRIRVRDLEPAVAVLLR